MPLKTDRNSLHWLGVIAVTLVCLALQGEWVWMAEYPKDLILPLSGWLNAVMGWIVDYFGWFFLGISWALEWLIKAVRSILNSLPWSVTTFLVGTVAWAASGGQRAAFTVVSIVYMLLLVF